MSMGIVNKDTAATIPAAGNTGDKVGNLAALHTTSKSDIVAAVNEVKDEQANKTDNDEVAPEFNNTTAYSTGELVYKDGQLYKFDSYHAAGAWDASEVSPTTVAAEFNQLKNTLTTKGQLDWSQATEVTMPYIPTKTGQLIISGVAIGAEGTLSISDYTASLVMFVTQVAHQNTGLGGSIMTVSGHEYRLATFNAQINKIVFVPVI